MDISSNDHTFLLFMEPTLPATSPTVDMYTRKITGALRASQMGGSGYSQHLPIFFAGAHPRSFHVCECGVFSTNRDYLIPTTDTQATVHVFANATAFFTGNVTESTPTQAVITNSLAIHYVACHRAEIPDTVLERILQLSAEEAEPTDIELKIPK